MIQVIEVTGTQRFSNNYSPKSKDGKFMKLIPLILDYGAGKSNKSWWYSRQRLYPLILFIAGLSICFPATCRGAEPKITLVKNGISKAAIVLPANPSNAARQGARILQDHIHQISGARLEMINESDISAEQIRNPRKDADDPNPDAYILVGQGDLTRKLGVTTKALGPGGIRILTLDNALILMGTDDSTPTDTRGTIYAVTTFMEGACGIRFLWPGELGKVVPEKSTITVQALDISYTPLLRERTIRSVQTGAGARKLEVGLDKLGLIRDEYDRTAAKSIQTASTDGGWFLWQKGGGNLGVQSGHAFGDYWRKYGKEHPEWFALQPDGTRDQSKNGERSRLCVSNTGLIQHIAEERIAQLNEHPDWKGVSLAPNDGGKNSFCMCKKCEALDSPDGRITQLWKSDSETGTRIYFDHVSLTDRYVYFWNEIARRVTQVHPDALFTVYAYSTYKYPPVDRELHPNLVVKYVGGSYRNELERKLYLKDWDAWAEKAQKIYFRPNILNSGKREGELFIYARKLAEDYQHMAKHGMIGVDHDKCVHNWATQGLNYYTAAKLNWNPFLDVNSLIADYCRAGFDQASNEIEEYFRIVEAVTDEVATSKEELSRKDVFEGYPSLAFTPERIRQLQNLLDAAVQAAGDNQQVKDRIVFLRTGLEWTAIQAEAHKFLEKMNQGEPIDRNAAHQLLDKRYQMAHDIFQNHHLTVNTAYVTWGESGRWRRLGWTYPAERRN